MSRPKLIKNNPIPTETNSEDTDKPIKVKPVDKISEVIGNKIFLTDFTAHFLIEEREGLPPKRYRITQYFPLLKIAVDKFYKSADFSEKEVAFKKAVCKKNGVIYAYLTIHKSNYNRLDDLRRQIEEQK